MCKLFMHLYYVAQGALNLNPWHQVLLPISIINHTKLFPLIYLYTLILLVLIIL